MCNPRSFLIAAGDELNIIISIRNSILVIPIVKSRAHMESVIAVTKHVAIQRKKVITIIVTLRQNAVFSMEAI